MTTRPKLYRMGWHLVLALLLLLMQQAGLHHALEHGSHEDEPASLHAACLLCAAHHVQGTAPGATPAPLATPPGLGHVLHAAGMAPQRDLGVSLGFQPRAPPLAVSA